MKTSNAGNIVKEVCLFPPQIGSQIHSHLAIDQNNQYGQVQQSDLALIEPTAHTLIFNMVEGVEPSSYHHIFSGSTFYNLNKQGGLNK
jgi:hypothetical protein